jgi:alpha,alpha-trehalase
MMTNRNLRRAVALFIISISLSSAAVAQAAPQPATGLDDILGYISKTWTTLSRSGEQCKTVTDERDKTKKSIIYFPADQPLPDAASDLEKRCNVDARQLPKPITGPGQFDPDKFQDHGVLYLPNPYVVPGGFFNEMYGWDSYFIIRGLLLDNQYDLARGMVENFFYEIEHYGSILNANRTYFLSRSQPPFLSAMVKAVYDAKPDKQWLAKALPYIERDYTMWTTGQHLAGQTGLSRYFDYGEGPTPDIAATGDPYYAELITALATNGIANDYVTAKSDVGPRYTLTSCIEGGPCAKPAVNGLTADYYKGDRSMRESGYDVSSRFGPYSGRTHHFAPVCLNSLLYQTERNMQQFSEILGNAGPARQWSDRAKARAATMNKLMWNQSKGMFFDWNFTKNQQSDYQYATMFFPLWVGLASDTQARALIANVKALEQPGGVVMSPYDTKLQWDYPYGWAPNNLVAVEGLRAYKANDVANRLTVKWLSMIVENFRRDGTIREKYNVVTRSDETEVAVGYHSNLIGFGWTNGAFLAMLKDLPAEDRAKLAAAKANTVAPN